MRIADVRAYPLRCKLREPFAYSQEWLTHRSENPTRAQVLLTSIRVTAGQAAVPLSPGLGVEANEETLERYGQ